LSYAENPKVNQGWMKADNPWQFIAACNELMRFRIWQMNVYENHKDVVAEYDYPSSLEVYIDGSNNGSQHLAALTKDEIIAPHVNLVPLNLPGDLYKYVGDHVWKHLEEELSLMTNEEIQDCERVIDNLIYLKKQINAAEPKSDFRKQLIEQIKEFKSENDQLIGIAAPVFWSRIKDAKHKRKIVKRNTMTIPYGGTAYGLGQQIIDDARKHNIELLLYMEHRWGAYLGREVFNDCKRSLEKPMQLLKIFEEAGRKAEQDDKFLSWTVPVTKFPVVQNYTEGIVKKIWVQYGPPQGVRNSTGYFDNTLQLAICFIEDVKPSKGKQSQGASPNIIHSLDAAHLSMIVASSDFPVTTIHDSFGCLLADMPKLFAVTRQTFVELYKQDPLTSIMKDIGGNANEVELGNLDLNLVIESEYCFC
jgi:DNA-directed RNA polymerase